MIFFFLPENRIWNFLQMVSHRDNLHEKSKAVYWLNKKHISKMSPAELLVQSPKRWISVNRWNWNYCCWTLSLQKVMIIGFCKEHNFIWDGSSLGSTYPKRCFLIYVTSCFYSIFMLRSHFTDVTFRFIFDGMAFSRIVMSTDNTANSSKLWTVFQWRSGTSPQSGNWPLILGRRGE